MPLTRSLTTLTAVLTLAATAGANRPDSVVTFNEVHYHPADGAAETEWIELHNQMAVDVALDRWSLQGGIDFTFPDGTIIPGGGQVTVAKEPAKLPGSLGPFTGSLDNAGDRVDLVNNSGRLMDRLDYGDAGDWPVAPDGSGATLAKRNPLTASGPSRSWTTSLQVGGTPGNANFPPPGQPVQHDLVNQAATWRYRDSNSPPPADWADPTFDDGAWPEGEAPLGTSSDAGPASLTVTASLLERFRASAVTGVADGATFSTWRDTATGDGATQNATAGGDPTFQANATPSGKPAVRFDGNDEFRTSASPGIGAGSGFVYFLVCKANGANADGGLNDGSGAYLLDRAGATTPLVSLKAVGGSYGLQKRHDNGTGLGGPQSTTPISTSDFQIVALRRNRSEDRFEIWVDGTLESTTADSGAGLTPPPLNIGRHATIAAGGFDGDIAEVLVYGSELSDNDFQSVGAYLESEYGLDTAFAGTTVRTPLAAGAPTAYLRHTFTFTGDPSRTTLRLDTAVADGAAVYLNGTEISRGNLQAGPLAHTTPSLTDPPEPLQSGFLPVPSDALVNGENTLAVSLHRGAPGSDTFFAAALAGTETPPDPDAPQSLVFNEVAPAIADENTFFVELANLGGTLALTEGYRIASSAGESFTIPPGIVQPGATLSLDEGVLGFRPARGERLFLLAPGGGSVADAQRVTDRLRGRSPGHPGRWLFPDSATPGADNAFTFNSDIVINEVHYHPAPLQPSEASLRTDPLFTYGHLWRYNESGADLGPGWATQDHPVGGDWKSGPGTLAFESGLPLPVGTTLSFPNFNDPYVVTYYFETDLTLTQQQADNIEALSLTHLVDDGAVVYLNGTEIFRAGMPAGPVTAATLATPANPEASLVGPVSAPVPPGVAVAGTNRLSVEVHQESTDSPDVAFGLDVGVTYGAPAMPFRESDEQWVELTNRGDQTVDLSGWSFAEGIRYDFPDGTTLAPGGFLVVAKNPTELARNHPGIDVLGPFGGSLARDGEDIRLRDAANNPADSLRYFDSGRWPRAADGGGSSLELTDPRADNSNPGAWAASDESSRTAWRTYSYTGRAAASRVGPDNQWREFVFGLLTAGEVLIDDLSVLENGAAQLIANGDFESGADGFNLIGNHRHGGVVPDPDNPGNHVLRLVASGPTEHMHNHVWTNLVGPRRVTNGRDYTVSFRARWVSGSPQLHTRLYFNRLPATTVLDTPPRSGTPGAPNSTRVDNAGPTLTNLQHTPAVPAAGEPVTVSVDAADPDGLGPLTLFYAVDGEAPFTAVPMTATGDTYSATLPGGTAAGLVQFYVAATDTRGAGSFAPAAGPDSRAMVQFEDGQAATTGAGNIRIIMTPADRTFFHTPTNVMSNDRMPCTVVVDETEVFYGTSVRIKGSERARLNPNRVGFNLRFGGDQLFRGVHRTVAVDRSEGQQVGQRELLFDLAMTNAGGVPAEYNDLVKVIAPDRRHTSFAILQLARFGAVFLDSQFDDGADGTVYEYELIYYPTTADRSTGLKLPQPDSVQGSNITNLGDDKENYRWTFNIKNNRERDDYTHIIAMAKHFDRRGSAFLDGLEDVIDVDQWLRALAFSCASGAGDSFFSNSRHNGQFYARPDGRVLYFPHDIDFAFNANRSITENQELQDIIRDPAYRRAYYGHLYDICTRVFNETYMQRWTDHFAALALPTFADDLRYIRDRSNSILSQVTRGIRQVDFAVTTNGGNGFSSNASPVTLEGTGWIDVDTIRLAGTTTVLPVEWTGTDDWEIELPLASGDNAIALEAYDRYDNLVGADTVTVAYTAPDLELASASNIAISEVHYNPSSDDGSDETHEFLELANISPDKTVDLTGVAFTDGITYTFPAGTTIAPGARLVLARDPSTYPGSLGPYTGALDNAGETLTLSALGGEDIRSFTYDDWAPWPDGTDGGGPSLVLIAPATDPDHALPQNWRASTGDGGNPGTSDAAPYSGGDLLTYALGPDPGLAYRQDGTLTFTPVPAADETVVTPQWSADLETWQSTGFTFHSPGAYTFTPPPGTPRRTYFRLHVQQRP